MCNDLFRVRIGKHVFIDSGNKFEHYPETTGRVSELLALPIVRNSKYKKTQRFGNLTSD
jgi:hypothetical protein